MIFKLYFMALKVEPFFNRKHNVVTDGVMSLRTGNQVLCNVWSYHFYDTTLHYENMPIQVYWKFYHQKMKIFR